LGELWPGVRVELHATAAGVEKHFMLARADAVTRIEVPLDGAQALTVDAHGALVMGTGLGAVAFSAPRAWQHVAGRRVDVAARWVLRGAGYGFALEAVDDAAPAVIDPLLHATFLGGDRGESLFAIARHPTSGEYYVAGATDSANFPGTAGGAQPTHASAARLRGDAFVARLSPTLQLMQATFLGGSEDDSALGVTIEPASGDVVIAGATESPNFPGTTGGAFPTIAADEWDGFVARLSGDLRTLRQSTFLGGSEEDDASMVVLHPVTGEVYVLGWTLSPDFPGVTGGADALNEGNGFEWDGFVARLTADLKTLRQATFFGGSQSDFLEAFAVVDAGVYVTGWTESTQLDATAGGAQPARGGAMYDGFAVLLNAELTRLVQTTWLGGSQDDFPLGLAVEPSSGDLFIGGNSWSADFPGTSGGAQPTFTPDGGREAFVSRLSADLTQLRQSTWLGGSSDDLVQDLAVSSAPPSVYVTGSTSSADFPGTLGGVQPTLAGGLDMFAARLSLDLRTLHQASYVGGSGNDSALTLALGGGQVVLGGVTRSGDIAVTPDAGQPTNGGGDDGYLAALDPGLGGSLTTPSADLALTKSAPATALAGANVTFRLVVTNAGPDPATGVTLDDPLGGWTSVSHATTRGTCSVTGGRLSCQLGTLTVGAEAVVELVASTSTTGTFTNHASVSATERDPSPANNAAEATVLLEPGGTGGGGGATGGGGGTTGGGEGGGGGDAAPPCCGCSAGEGLLAAALVGWTALRRRRLN
ncbi:MAG: DUF11 domain-containing protein, partial [Myxococcota bacterium]